MTQIQKMQLINQAFWYGWEAGIRVARLTSKKTNLDKIHADTFNSIAGEALIEAFETLTNGGTNDN